MTQADSSRVVAEAVSESVNCAHAVASGRAERWADDDWSFFVACLRRIDPRLLAAQPDPVWLELVDALPGLILAADASRAQGSATTELRLLTRRFASGLVAKLRDAEDP